MLLKECVLQAKAIVTIQAGVGPMVLIDETGLWRYVINLLIVKISHEFDGYWWRRCNDQWWLWLFIVGIQWWRLILCGD